MNEIDLSFLKGKRYLIISPPFFGYASIIKRTIEKAGGSAIIIDERPSNSFIVKAVIRVNSSLIRRRIEKYYFNKIESIVDSEAFDFVLVVSPEAINGRVLYELKKRLPQAKFVLYMYDSLRNKMGSRAEKLFPHFDRLLSFDRSDCITHPGMIFRPLFYSEEYAAIPRSCREFKYGLSFIGTLHSDRYAISRKIGALLASRGINTFTYLYLSDTKLFWIQKIRNRSLRGCRFEDVAFIPMPRNEVLEVMEKSLAILDVQHPLQTGLTMRTIEVLGAGRKLVTTNEEICDYDFYNENNVCLINRADPRIPDDFLQTPYKEPDRAVYIRYSIEGWLLDVLGGYYRANDTMKVVS